MSIETICNDCGTVLSIAEEHAGRRARCPQCKTEYEVPQSSDLSSLDDQCHFCGKPIDSADPSFIEASAEVSYRICPECQESIDENQKELEEESLRSDSARNGLIAAGIVVGGILLAIYLTRLTFIQP